MPSGTIFPTRGGSSEEFAKGGAVFWLAGKNGSPDKVDGAELCSAFQAQKLYKTLRLSLHARHVFGRPDVLDERYAPESLPGAVRPPRAGHGEIEGRPPASFSAYVRATLDASCRLDCALSLRCS